MCVKHRYFYREIAPRRRRNVHPGTRYFESYRGIHHTSSEVLNEKTFIITDLA